MVCVPVYQLAPMFRQKQDIRHESPEKGGHSEKKGTIHSAD